jgi:hypothetical protein
MNYLQFIGQQLIKLFTYIKSYDSLYYLDKLYDY